MKHLIFMSISLLLACHILAQDKIWFKQPASQWDNALPIGNGRLGAMVFGDVDLERIQLNEESLWTGRDRMSVV